MNAISQTTCSSRFSWIKMSEFQFKFHWSLFPRAQLTIFQHWFRYWLGAVQATSHYLNQWWLIYRRKYASLGLNELSACRSRMRSSCANIMFDHQRKQNSQFISTVMMWYRWMIRSLCHLIVNGPLGNQITLSRMWRKPGKCPIKPY